MTSALPWPWTCPPFSIGSAKLLGSLHLLSSLHHPHARALLGKGDAEASRQDPGAISSLCDLVPVTQPHYVPLPLCLTSG